MDIYEKHSKYETINICGIKYKITHLDTSSKYNKIKLFIGLIKHSIIKYNKILSKTFYHILDKSFEYYLLEFYLLLVINVCAFYIYMIMYYTSIEFVSLKIKYKTCDNISFEILSTVLIICKLIVIQGIYALIMSIAPLIILCIIIFIIEKLIDFINFIITKIKTVINFILYYLNCFTLPHIEEVDPIEEV